MSGYPNQSGQPHRNYTIGQIDAMFNSGVFNNNFSLSTPSYNFVQNMYPQTSNASHQVVSQPLYQSAQPATYLSPNQDYSNQSLYQHHLEAHERALNGRMPSLTNEVRKVNQNHQDFAYNGTHSANLNSYAPQFQPTKVYQVPEAAYQTTSQQNLNNIPQQTNIYQTTNSSSQAQPVPNNQINYPNQYVPAAGLQNNSVPTPAINPLLTTIKPYSSNNLQESSRLNIPLEDKKPAVPSIASQPAELGSNQKLNSSPRLTPQEIAVNNVSWILQKKDPSNLNQAMGIKNIGQTCYFNSILQSLFAIEDFQKELLELKIPEDYERKNFSAYEVAAIKFVEELQKFFALMMFSNYKCVDPTPIADNIVDSRGRKVIIGDQLDLSEFFLRMVELMEIAFTRIQGSPATVSKFFGGIIRSFITFPDGSSSRSASESLNPLMVDLIGGQLEKAISSQFRYEVHGVENDGQKMDGMKTLWIDGMPKCLIIILKRVIMNPKTFQLEKDNSVFKFPEELLMDRYLLSNRSKIENFELLRMQSMTFNHHLQQTDEAKFKLRSVVLHLGNHLSGHYQALIEKNNTWSLCDDLRTEIKGDSRVLNDAFGDGVSSKNGYVLIYEQVARSNKNIKLTPKLQQYVSMSDAIRPTLYNQAFQQEVQRQINIESQGYQPSNTGGLSIINGSSLEEQVSNVIARAKEDENTLAPFAYASSPPRIFDLNLFASDVMPDRMEKDAAMRSVLMSRVISNSLLTNLGVKSFADVRKNPTLGPIFEAQLPRYEMYIPESLSFSEAKLVGLFKSECKKMAFQDCSFKAAIDYPRLYLLSQFSLLEKSTNSFDGQNLDDGQTNLVFIIVSALKMRQVNPNLKKFIMDTFAFLNLLKNKYITNDYTRKFLVAALQLNSNLYQDQDIILSYQGANNFDKQKVDQEIKSIIDNSLSLIGTFSKLSQLENQSSTSLLSLSPELKTEFQRIYNLYKDRGYLLSKDLSDALRSRQTIEQVLANKNIKWANLKF